jgi:SulP family sulfate permease
MTVFIDLIMAVGVGLILASFVTAKRAESHELDGVTALALSQDDDEFSEEENALLQEVDGDVGIIRMRGRFSYASARELTHVIELAGEKAIIYDFTETAYVDTSAALAIEDMLTSAAEQTECCYVCGVRGETRKTLTSLGSLDVIPRNHIFNTRIEAISAVASGGA